MGITDITETGTFENPDIETRVLARIRMEDGTSFAVKEGSLPISIGRSSDCDICIPEGHISRQHCNLSVIDNELMLTDTSANGTDIGLRRLLDESAPSRSTTTFNLGGWATITITPTLIDQERRLASNRRSDQRRDTSERREIVTVIDFDRRHGRRRASKRRIVRRRAA